jgi:hypothetical protein
LIWYAIAVVLRQLHIDRVHIIIVSVHSEAQLSSV